MAGALGDIGHARGIEPLTTLAADANQSVRAHTAIALAQIGDRRGIPLLEKLASDPVQRAAGISQQALTSLRSALGNT